jgi:hypothetical protein
MWPERKQSKWWIDLRYMWVCIQYEHSRETIRNRVFRLQYTKQYNLCFCLHGMYALYDWSPYKNKTLYSFENKQRSFSDISYMVFFTNLTINGFISSYPLINGFCQNFWHIVVDRDWRECKDRQLWEEIAW